MVSKSRRGAGLVETILILPIISLLIAGTLVVYKILESKNMALYDAYQINLISGRLKRDLKNPLTEDLHVDNRDVTIRRIAGNRTFFDNFSHAPLSWKSEVELAFTPKKKSLSSWIEEDPQRILEKNLILIDSWDDRSRFGKKLKMSIDITHAIILAGLFGR
ncbi:MAG: hypothetical protein GTN70_03690 [Deltaproteobacteria bacterium]|nr:hypothetical protein [Deltaproteobacteria bacterium]NIS76755.1 hypothetical protein [Deltaproteobacteria bacterium]